MILTLLKTGYRSLLRRKGFSLLNIAGLSLGLLACLLIGLFVRDEQRFDRFVPGGDRTYRALYQIRSAEGTTLAATTPPTFPGALQGNFPEVEATLRLFNIKSTLLMEQGAQRIYAEGGVLADPSFFDFFPLLFTEGTRSGALTDPRGLVISSDLATRLFGKESALGKTVQVGKDPFRVTGVFAREPRFHLALDYVLPLASQGIAPERLQDWGWYGFYNYVRLKKGADVHALEAGFRKLTNPILNKEAGTVFTPYFQPLHDIHLRSTELQYDMADRGNGTYVRALLLIAGFILAIACFNFVNLATAQSLQRAREVGVRKAIGAGRRQLMAQYLVETILLVLISMTLALVLAALLLPALNAFTGKSIRFNLAAEPATAAGLFALAVGVGLLAGFYPALVLSGYRPVTVLKGTPGSEAGPAAKGVVLRKGLVVLQFTLSVLLLISALVVIRQVNFLHSKELGFDKEQVLLLPIKGDRLRASTDAFRNELLRSPQVRSVSVGYGFPGDQWGDGIVTVPARQVKHKVNLLMVDNQYLPTLGLTLAAGRNFSSALRTDEGAFLLNETAVRDLGFSSAAAAIGQELQWPTWRNPDSVKQGRIIGVVRDFHYQSMHDKIAPAVLQVYTPAYAKIAVKIAAGATPAALAHVKEVWGRYAPDYPVEYSFLDERFAAMYHDEQQAKTLLSLFTGVAVFVACLGLLGLVTYAAARRRKEIGIRKVLGASVRGIVLLLTREFLLLVLLAVALAAPLAWYFMNGWLQSFAYRIDMGWWMFAGAAGLALAVAFLTAGLQALRAARATSVRNLKAE